MLQVVRVYHVDVGPFFSYTPHDTLCKKKRQCIAGMGQTLPRSPLDTDADRQGWCPGPAQSFLLLYVFDFRIF